MAAVNRSRRAIVLQLQSGRQFKGVCPTCSGDFYLADAVLFHIDDAPPEEALATIQTARQAIKERKQEIAKARERMSRRAQKTSEAVNIGKIVEKIIPSFPSFAHSPEDCRLLLEPIDYLIFPGLAKTGQADSVFFVDVKSGNARLSNDQKAIKSAIDAGLVDFATIEHVRSNE